MSKPDKIIGKAPRTMETSVGRNTFSNNDPFRKLLLQLGLILGIASLASLAFFASPRRSPNQSQPIIDDHVDQGAAATPVAAKAGLEPQTLNDLLTLSPEDLAKVDVARMNLLCATGLPGAEKLNIDHALATLDRWAQRVAFETERHLYRATDPRYAEHYHHSETYLRAEFLLQTLQEDLGIKYDMTAADNFSFADSRVAFLHGMIPAPGQTAADTSGGTCASMPVMYLAVGRRLGYPLKLVTTDSHCFVRWDGLDHPNPAWRERFNIEGSGSGFESLDDDYYKNWPVKLDEHEVQANRYLISLTPAEELAGFLAARGHCAVDNGEVASAARCFENACRYDPTRPAFRSWFVDAAMRSGYQPATSWLRELIAQRRLALTISLPSRSAQRLSQEKAALQAVPSVLNLPQPATGNPASSNHSFDPPSQTTPPRSLP